MCGLFAVISYRNTRQILNGIQYPLVPMDFGIACGIRDVLPTCFEKAERGRH